GAQLSRGSIALRRSEGANGSLDGRQRLVRDCLEESFDWAADFRPSRPDSLRRGIEKIAEDLLELGQAGDLQQVGGQLPLFSGAERAARCETRKRVAIEVRHDALRLATRAPIRS